jgi:hypothetical protein
MLTEFDFDTAGFDPGLPPPQAVGIKFLESSPIQSVRAMAVQSAIALESAHKAALIADDPLPDSDPGFLLNPLTEAIIPPDDVDQMIDAYQEMKCFGDRLYAAQIAIRTKLADITKGQTEAKTRRVQGRRRKAKIEMPSPGWDQSILKEAWNAYPQLRDQCLKIDTVGVKAREWKKLAETAGVPEVETFRDMIKAAVKPPTGAPTITIEE